MFTRTGRDESQAELIEDFKILRALESAALDWVLKYLKEFATKNLPWHHPRTFPALWNVPSCKKHSFSPSPPREHKFRSTQSSSIRFDVNTICFCCFFVARWIYHVFLLFSGSACSCADRKGNLNGKNFFLIIGEVFCFSVCCDDSRELFIFFLFVFPSRRLI